MKKLILLSLLIAANAWAITIPLPTLPSPGTLTTEIIVPINGLEGTPVSGQTLDLTIPFPAGTYLRLFPSTEVFITLIKLNLDAPPSGFPSGTGALLDSFGNPIVEGSLGAANSDSFLATGLVLTSLPPNPIDVFGVRYLIDLPVESSTVVGSEFRAVGNGPFLVGPTVPDTGHAAVLLGCGLFALFCAAQCRAVCSVGRAISPETGTF